MLSIRITCRLAAVSIAVVTWLTVGCGGGPELGSKTFGCQTDDDCFEEFVCQANAQKQPRCIGKEEAERELERRRTETTDIACESDADCAAGFVCQADDQMEKRCIGKEAASREVEERRLMESDVPCGSEDDCGRGFVCQADDQMYERCIGTVAAEREIEERKTTVTDVTCESKVDCAEGFVCRNFAAREGRNCVGTETAIQVSAGAMHTCALLANGEIRCWGIGSDPDREEDSPRGFLADYDQASPPSEAAFVDLDAEGGHTCAVKRDGGVVCWGLGSATGTDEARRIDVNQALPPSELSLREVSAGGYLSCGLTGEGAIECWGAVGNDESPPSGTGYAQVSVGGGAKISDGDLQSHACVLGGEFGRVTCWGADGEGQTDTPLGNYLQLSAGTTHSCAIAEEGGVDCWGEDTSSWNGRGAAGSERVSIRQVSVGHIHACGLTEEGEIGCWGEGSTFDAAKPPPGDGDAYAQVTAGYEHNCALTTNGRVDCWGRQGYGRLSPPSSLEALEE